MDDLQADKLRPILDKLAGAVDPVASEAYLEVVKNHAGVHHLRGNAAGFFCAGIRLIKQGLNAAGVPSDQPLSIDLRQFTIEKDKSGWLID